MTNDQEQRHVGLRTIFDLLKQKPVHLFLGVIFTLIPFLFGGIFTLVFSFTGSEGPSVDYELVSKNGLPTWATITDIEVQENISIDNEHPRIISYTYKNNDQEFNDKFKTLDSIKTSRLNIGDSVQMKYFKGQTIITGIKPYAFPTAILSIVLIPLLIIGLTTLVLLYRRVKNQIDLFKSGKVINAEIISMTPTSGLSISDNGQKVVVHYQYQTTIGQKLLGESATTDFTILTSKKQGDNIKIFVSPNDETKSCVIPRLDEIRNNWKIS